MDKRDREEIARIVNQQIRKALLQGGLISNKMDEIHAVIWKDVQPVKADIKKLREDLDKHFERHLRALERRKRAKA